MMLTIVIFFDNKRYIMLLIALVFFLIDACKIKGEKGLLDVFIMQTGPCCPVFTAVKQYSYIVCALL